MVKLGLFLGKGTALNFLYFSNRSCIACYCSLVLVIVLFLFLLRKIQGQQVIFVALVLIVKNDFLRFFFPPNVKHNVYTFNILHIHLEKLCLLRKERTTTLY